MKIIFYGRIDDKQEEFKKARLSALSAVKDIQTKEVADLYLLLSSLGFSTKSARNRYADIGADMYSEVCWERVAMRPCKLGLEQPVSYLSPSRLARSKN